MMPAQYLLVVTSGVLGLFIGSFLNVIADRVPAHISPVRERRCPRHDVRITPWQSVPVVSWVALRGTCAGCGDRTSMRHPIVEIGTGLSFALVAWWGSTFSPAAAGVWALGIVLIAYLYFAALSIVLTLIDLDTHRLPNSIVLPSYLVAGFLFTAAAWLTGDWAALLAAGVGMIALYLFYLLLRVARPGGMGGGDVKLAGVIGIYLGWVGWGSLVVGAFAAFLFGGVFGIALMLSRRAGRKTSIPFGPWMLLGAWTGVFAGGAIARSYVNVLGGA